MNEEQIKDALMVFKNLDCCDVDCDNCIFGKIEKVVLENGRAFCCIVDALDFLLKDEDK